MAGVPAREAEWAAWFANPEPLDVRLYGTTGHMCTQPGVQSASTVTEMIERSRVPQDMWYAPLPEPKPTVPKDVAEDVAVRVLMLRAAKSRNEVATLLGLTSSSAVYRLEQGNIHVNEVEAVEAALDRAGV